MKNTFQGFKELVYPKFCIICSKKDYSICEICLKPWSDKPKISNIGDNYFERANIYRGRSKAD